MKGAIARANELQKETPKSWIPMQFDNPANVDRAQAHDGGGDRRRLPGRPRLPHHRGRHRWPHHRHRRGRSSRGGPQLKVFAVEPTLSPVLSGRTHSPHPIQGIGAGFIPGVMRVDLLDGVIQVDPEDAAEYARRAAP